MSQIIAHHTNFDIHTAPRTTPTEVTAARVIAIVQGALVLAAGVLMVLDGPYADTKEQLGGFHVIDVPDLDAALQWAARCPTALHGIVEVRPLMDKSLFQIREEIATCGS